MNKLSQAILQTINYFDLFEYPLTSWEIKKFLWDYKTPIFKAIIKEQLDNLIRTKTLETKEGFYFLPGKTTLVNIRKDRYLLGQTKMQITLRYAKLISKFPFVKAIFITNTLAYLNTKKTSDLDLAIITTKHKIWTTRLFTTGFLKLLNKRPRPNNQQNKICLSFFLDEDSLNLKKVAYQNDIHFQYWLRQWLPIYDTSDYATKFWTANKWASKNLSNFFGTKICARWQIKKNSVSQKLIEPLLGVWVETLAKNLQLKIMPQALKIKAKEPNTDVVISNGLLKFHDKDKRLVYKQLWAKANNYFL